MTTDNFLYQNPDLAADKFLAALLPLLKRERFENITITQLCQEAGLSRKTFYENFKKKEDLLDYFIKANCIVYPTMKQELSPLLHYFTYWNNLREWILVFIENDLWYELNSMAIKQFIPIMTNFNWKALFGDCYINEELVLQFYTAGFSEIMKQWALHGFIETPEQLAEMTTMLVSEKFRG